MDLFNKRKKLKEAGNSCGQEVVKLIMNSSYGKCCLKPSRDQSNVVYDKDFDKYMKLHGSDINRIVDYDGFKCVSL